jgi:NADPH:quinone reductase-like Zn-dependent oxidoreductase
MDTPAALMSTNRDVPCGFGCDFAGVVDEVGAGAQGFMVGARVYGGALAKAVAEFMVMTAPAAPPEVLFHTPDGIGDEVAAALPIPGLTAAAAVQTIRHRAPSTSCGRWAPSRWLTAQGSPTGYARGLPAV